MSITFTSDAIYFLSAIFAHFISLFFPVDEVGTERQAKSMWQTSISMEYCREHFILHPDVESLHKGIYPLFNVK